jgi:hypothetical protein
MTAELSLPEKVRARKPSNVLLGCDDEGHWWPTVMDFGLAYEINRGHRATAARSRSGPSASKTRRGPR